MKKIYTINTSLSGDCGTSIVSQVEAALMKFTDEQIKDAAATLPSIGKKGKPAKLIFTGDAVNRIDLLSKSSGMDAATVIAVLASFIETGAAEAATQVTPMAKWLAVSDRQPREGQDEFYNNLYTTLDEGMIGLCEASTGSGKTTAILVALTEKITGFGCRGLIATPAIALVRDFAIEHARLGASAPPLRIFLGQGEFVSENEILDFLNNWSGHDEQSAGIRNWLEAGAPSLENGISQHYLKHSLRLISADIPLDEVLLREGTDEADPGMQAYRHQFNKELNFAGAEEILLCSHSMLAVDLRTRLAVAARSGALTDPKSSIDEAWRKIKANKKANLDNTEAIAQRSLAQEQWDQTVLDASAGFGRLPDYGYLVIDEAHMLEQSFSNSLSNYVSLHQFLLHARDLQQNGLLTKMAVTSIDQSYRALCNLARKESTDTVHLSRLHSELLAPLNEIAATLKASLGKVSKKRLESLSSATQSKLAAFRSDLACINQAAHSIAGQIAYINLSPRLAYPRLFVGRSSVDQYLRFLWVSVKGAACVSATLYIPKGDGWHSGYMQSILAIPNDRKLDFIPITPRWISDTIKSVRMPSCELVNGRLPLRPSSRSEKLSAEQKDASDSLWCQDVADEITRIYDSAAGGCLVLMTSYQYVNKVKSFLMKNPDLCPNIIFAQQGEISTKVTPKTQPITIDEQRRKYLRLAFEGKKPLWLALGNAWTGINLSGGDVMKDLCGQEIPAGEDNVLTDLIIPRLPFGVNKSVTHTYRMTHKKKVPWERIDTLLRLRQGVGRLVRRHGLPQNRRIHILDARLCQGTLSDMMGSVEKAVGGNGKKLVRR